MTVKTEKKIEKAKLNTVYVWQDGNVICAAAKVLLNDQEQLYGYSWKIEKPFWSKNTNTKMWIRRARHNSITHVQNTLNAIRLYGKKILDRNGNVSWTEFRRQERLHAYYIPDWEEKYKIIKYPVKDILLKKAIELKIT